MSDLFEVLLYEAVNIKVDLPVVISIDGNATIFGEIDSSQEYTPFSPPRYTRFLNASLIDGKGSAGDASLRAPRPPRSSAIALPGGPNRRWLVTIGATIVTGEEVGWERWLDYNSVTNGGGWNADLVAALKRRYPFTADERAHFHLINVCFHTRQMESPLGGPVYVPTGDIACFGSRW